MSETPHEPIPDEADLTEPGVTEVPEPDQEPGEPNPDEDPDENPDLEPQEPGEPGEPQPETPEAQAMSEADLERAFKAIARSYKTYTAAVARNLEEQANDLLPCPLCEGAVPSFVNRHDAGHVDEETTGAVYAFLNMTPPTTLNESRLNETCQTCSGLGKLLTGSRVPEWETKTCPDCFGAGFTGPGNPMHSPPVEAVTPNGEATEGAGVNLEAALAAIKGGDGS